MWPSSNTCSASFSSCWSPCLKRVESFVTKESSTILAGSTQSIDNGAQMLALLFHDDVGIESSAAGRRQWLVTRPINE